MQTLHIAVDGPKLRVIDKPTIMVAGSVGVMQVRFAFDGEWDGWKAVADFDGEAVPIVDSKCTVPASATAKKRYSMRIVGAKGNARMVTETIAIVQIGG